MLFIRTTDLVQRLQPARQALQLEAAIAKLDKYDLLILDDLAYVHKRPGRDLVLFELIAARYERRSMLITANQPFGDWNKVFPDPAMMIAAIDRLVHHAIIFEMNVESYRRRTATRTKDRARRRHRKGHRGRRAVIVAPQRQSGSGLVPLASGNQQRQSSLPSAVAVSILIVARIRPDCRATNYTFTPRSPDT